MHNLDDPCERALISFFKFITKLLNTLFESLFELKFERFNDNLSLLGRLNTDAARSRMVRFHIQLQIKIRNKLDKYDKLRNSTFGLDE